MQVGSFWDSSKSSLSMQRGGLATSEGQGSDDQPGSSGDQGVWLRDISLYPSIYRHP